jgi:hypothetical protein
MGATLAGDFLVGAGLAGDFLVGAGLAGDFLSFANERRTTQPKTP